MSHHKFFWRQHPALGFAATLLIAAGAVLFLEGSAKWIFPFLWAVYLASMKKWPLLILLPVFAAYCHFRFEKAPEPQSAEGIFSITSLQPHRSPFQKGWCYKGEILLPQGSYPCTVYTQGCSPARKADCDYFIAGKFVRLGKFDLLFKPSQWIPIEGSWSSAHLRYLAKERYRAFLKSQCPNHPRSAEFLASLTTGDVEDRLLKYEFGRLGLQHILAISGFHFGVLIAFSSFVLSLFVPRIGKWLLLLLGLTAYYFFVGPFCGVQRSWLTAIAYIAAKLLKRNTSGLNLLGFALAFEVISNPLIVSNIGFQLSFASCAGILLLYPLCEKMLQTLLPMRKSAEKAILPFIAKHAHLVSGFLRRGIAITLAVNAAILPILLVHFHVFPLLSLLYNLFYPFCIGIVLSVLLISLAVHFLFPPLAPLLFSTTAYFTDLLLALAAYPPAALDYPLLAPNFPVSAVPFCLFLALLLSIRSSELAHRSQL